MSFLKQFEYHKLLEKVAYIKHSIHYLPISPSFLTLTKKSPVFNVTATVITYQNIV